MHLHAATARGSPAGRLQAREFLAPNTGICAFKISSPGGTTILFDPWRDDPSGAWGLWFKNEFPETPVDITMSTHTHFDHDAIHRPKSTMVLDRMVGTFEFADIRA